MLKQAPIRYRMTLFYLVLTGILLTLFLWLLFFTTEAVLRTNQEELLRLSVAQLSSQIEAEDGTIVLEGDMELSQNSGYLLTHLDGSVVARQRMPEWAEALTFLPEEIREVQQEGDSWLLLDGMADEDGTDIQVRAILSIEAVYDTMSVMRTICFIGVPLLLLVATLGGLWIARHSLRPIDHIIATTKAIARGNMAERIENVSTKDEVGELALTMNDMLEKVETAYLKEKRFASDASHELRTPIAIVMNYSEALLAQKNDAQDAEMLEAILRESRHMDRIVSQLLMITRGMENRYPFEPEALDVNEIVVSVIEQVMPLAEDKGISIVTEIDPTASLQGDQSLLTQMMLNLMENSVKYSKENGSVQISVQMQGRKCTIRVEDNGIGISAENLPKIYDRFFRVDTSRDRSGSGLGLSIVKWIVDMHQGSVQVKSREGKGTQFIIRI